MNLCSQCFTIFRSLFGNSSASVCKLCSPVSTSFLRCRLQSVKPISSQVYSPFITSPLFLRQSRLFSNINILSSYGRRYTNEKTTRMFGSTENALFLRQYANEANPKKVPSTKKNKAKTEDSGKSPISWRNLLIVTGIAGVMLIGMNQVKKEKRREKEKMQNRKMGKARLGGDWTLVDHHGNLRSSKDFRGQWLLIYFGFTNCPDICPEEMDKIVAVINQTDEDSELPKLQPVLITVDPERDTPEALKEYCAEFSPRILGFSGTTDQINVATRAFRVYYSAGPKDEDNDYIVDHSIISYLINPEGDFVEFFGQNKKVNEIYKSIKLHISSYMKQHGQWVNK